MEDVFQKLSRDYFRARPWRLEADGSFKISSLDMDDDDPAQWGDATMTSDDPEPKTPEQYFQNGRAWLDAAEDIAEEKQDASTLAILAIASALLGICAQFIREQKAD